VRVQRAPLPVSHSAHVTPFLDFAGGLGAPVQRALELERLPSILVERKSIYVPTVAAWGLTDRIAREQGIADIGFRVGHSGGLGLIGPRLSRRLLDAPTLRVALRAFCDYIRLESSEMRCWLTQDGDEIRFHLRKSFGRETRGYGQTEWLGLSAMLTALQLFAPPEWEPSTISRSSTSHAPDLVSEMFGNTRLPSGQRQIYIAFPRRMLASPRYPHASSSRLGRSAPASDPYCSDRPEDEFTGRLIQCLQPHLRDGYPHVRLAAEISGISVRTLQRRLADEGHTYRSLVDRVRFEVASSLLRDTDATSTEIAYATAHTDSSNFARTFRRITGLSPREYRAQRGFASDRLSVDAQPR